MADFSHLHPQDYRAGYFKWRSGEARGAKGEPNRPSSHTVTLVHTSCETWELHLAQKPKPAQRQAYRNGYAMWCMEPSMDPSISARPQAAAS